MAANEAESILRTESDSSEEPSCSLESNRLEICSSQDVLEINDPESTLLDEFQDSKPPLKSNITSPEKLVPDLSKNEANKDFNLARNSHEGTPHDCLIEKIYEISNKRLKIEMCIRLDKLISNNSIELIDLKNPNLIESLEFIEDLNIELIDQFIRDPSSYIGKKLRICQLICGIKNMKLLVEKFKTEQKQAVDTVTVTRENLIQELDKQGYKFCWTPKVRAIRLKDELLAEKGDSKSFERRYGMKLSETQFGKICFLSNLPTDRVLDVELINVFRKVGTVYKLLIDVDESGKPKGTGIVEFMTRESARNAIKSLNGHELVPNHFVKVSEHFSYFHLKLCLFSIPESIDDQELKDLLVLNFEGIRLIEIHWYTSNSVPSRYAILDFFKRSSAENCKKTLDDKILYPTLNIIAQWYNADFTRLFVHNVPATSTNDEIIQTFEKISKVVSFNREVDHIVMRLESPIDNIIARDEFNDLTLGGQRIRIRFGKRPSGFDSRSPLRSTNRFINLRTPSLSNSPPKLETTKRSSDALTEEDSSDQENSPPKRTRF